MSTNASRLPPGWRVKVKVRTSGSRTRVEKHYYEPITGRMFRSMSNILYYLEHGPYWNTDSPSDHMEGQRSNRSSRKAKEPTPPATLPPPPLNFDFDNPPEKVSPSPDSSGHQAESKSRKRLAPGDKMSRRRSNRVRNSRHVTSSAPVTIIDDCEEDDHRTCWKHIVALNKCGSKPKRIKDLEIFKLSAPCFYDECTRRERSKRRIKCKYLVSKLRKKLYSNAFEDYLEDVWRGFSDEKKNSFVYLDGLWFSMYKSELRSCVFDSIKTKQIFSKKYVFLPIVYWSHWTLLIFCNFGGDLNSGNTCMLFLDSLQTTDSSQRLQPDIRKFVLDIYRTEGRTEDPSLVDEIPLFTPKVPQQTNDVECGSFVLYYIQRFIEDAPEDFIVKDFPYFMKDDWFSHKELEEFCDKLDSLGVKSFNF